MGLKEAQLAEELESLRKDAERYRWLWKNTVEIFHGRGAGQMHIANVQPSHEGIDAIIDAAIRAIPAQRMCETDSNEVKSIAKLG